MKPLITALALALVGTAGAASAATLSTGPLGSGLFGATVAVLPEATITSFGDDLFFGGADGRSDSFCAIAGGCAADMEIAFTAPVSNLTFATGGFGPGDSVLVSAFDEMDDFLGSILVEADTTVDFTAFASIGRLFFDDSSTASGFGYGTFSFDVGMAPIPVPASLPLLLAGFGALAFARRRKG